MTLAAEKPRNIPQAEDSSDPTGRASVDTSAAVFDLIDHPVAAKYLANYPIVLKSREVWELMIAERAATTANSEPPQAARS